MRHPAVQRVFVSYAACAAAVALALVLLRHDERLWLPLGAVALMGVLGLLHLRQIAGRYGSVAAVLEQQPGTYEGSDTAQQLRELIARQQAAAAHSQQESRELLAVLEGMTEGVLAVDAAERVQHMNAAAATMLGTTATEAVGKHVWEATRMTAVIDVLRAALKERQEAAGELRLPESGGDRYLELHASPLGSAGKATGAVLVLHDTTRLRRLEQIRRDFVSNVGHELKTPLTAIHALVETVLDDSAMSAITRDEFLRKTIAQSLRLQALVSDLLLLSRVETQEETMILERLDFSKPISESLSTLQPAAGAKQIEVGFSSGEAAVYVLGDREMLRQAAGNLIDNAIKYSKEGSSVEVRLERSGTNARLIVTDQGVGIPIDDQARIFERFYRVDKARSREVGGTGLGLAIVKHIALAHKGSVKLVSRLGQGSTFTLEIPLTDA